MISSAIFVFFNFIFYSFLGWVIEHLYSLYQSNHFKKDYFLIGPWKPMYGIAFTILVICSIAFNSNIFLMIPLSLVVPTFIEYLSGYSLKRLFNKTYWDYSSLKYNLHGFISFIFSVYWTFLCLIGIYYVQPIINKIIFIFMDFWLLVVPLLMLIFIFDFYFTIKRFDKVLS